MQTVRTITDDLYYLGGSDRRLALFESAYPIPRGVSYNSYLLADEKTVLLDTVDPAVQDVFFENLEAALAGRKLDYAVVHHMEPDHAGTLQRLVELYPDVTLVVNAKIQNMIRQFFAFSHENVLVVKDGDTLCTGKHTLAFVFAPMVHWPEVMVSFDTTDGTLFSADAFGTFGALSGNLYADEYDFERDWLDDARRYYTNIVGKYGVQVQAVLKKAAALPIQRICPLHGPIWRENLGWFIEKYDLWSKYAPEEKGVVIAYASIYGHTQNACDVLANELAKLGVKNIAMYDTAVTPVSELVSQCFKRSHLVFASASYNGGLFDSMEHLLRDLAAHGLKNRTCAILENGSWAPSAKRVMLEILCKMKDMAILEPQITVTSALKPETDAQVKELAKAIVDSMAD